MKDSLSLLLKDIGDTITQLSRRLRKIEAMRSFSIAVVALDPKDATPANRPQGKVTEIVYYSGKLYFCTNATTPTWELITSA